jgi:Xaa-Pro aminopeptidase
MIAVNRMTTKVPLPELADRMNRFRARMDAENLGWQLAAVLGRVNQYYFTGTMQDALLLVPRDAEPTLWVRRSFERARTESLFPDIRPMKSFRDAAPASPIACEVIHFEAEVVPYALLQRFRKYFPCKTVAPLDAQVAKVRAVKSPYELAILERAGAIHRRVLEEQVPALLREGISEAELGCELLSLMVREGHQGIARFAMFGSEILLGQLGFGENSLCPTSFDGPGGCLGLEPAAPVLGSRVRTLRPGDLVFIDVGCGVAGYHTDKTMTYVFGGPPPEVALAAHRRCFDLEQEMAAMLKPGAIPSQIHAAVMGKLDREFLQNFMGFGNRRVNFLGHGVGLQVDEPPAIAQGFDEPLVEGMVLALEPKKGVPDFGMVGVEDTFVVTPEGGRSITGHSPGLIQVPRA